MQRGVLLYLFAIAAPALILLYLGLQSVQRERQAIAALAESNRVLAAEKLTAGLERGTRQLAETCLREQEFAPPFRAACPLAQHFFIVLGGRLVYPPLQSPPPRDPPGIPALFRKAESPEFRDQLPQALEAYHAVYDASVPPAAKALALCRVARCLDKLRRRPEAVAAWQRLRDQ